MSNIEIADSLNTALSKLAMLKAIKYSEIEGRAEFAVHQLLHEVAELVEGVAQANR
jgi:hypothetical protein